jgi:hypothetical protein
MMGAVPIRRRLSSIALITTGVALLVTIVAFLAGEFVASRRSSLQELRILSEAIASNSTAALAFENQEDAHGTSSARRSTRRTVICSWGIPRPSPPAPSRPRPWRPVTTSKGRR